MQIRLKDLKIGDTVLFGKYANNPIVWLVSEHDHKGFPKGSTSLVSLNILDGIPFDAKEPENDDEYVARFGNNNYALSNIRQWMNSDAKDWFQKTHEHDEPPIEENVWSNPYVDKPGFLSEFTDAEKALMLNTVINTENKQSDKNILDRVFLLSAREVGFDEGDGELLELFKNPAHRIAVLDEKAAETIDEPVSSPWYWWLRSPCVSSSYGVRFVKTAGVLGHYGACNGTHGLRPACNLSSDIFVSEISDGVYEICESKPEKKILDDRVSLNISIGDMIKLIKLIAPSGKTIKLQLTLE